MITILKHLNTAGEDEDDLGFLESSGSEWNITDEDNSESEAKEYSYQNDNPVVENSKTKLAESHNSKKKLAAAHTYLCW